MRWILQMMKLRVLQQINGRRRKQNPTTEDRKEIAELKKEKGILYKYKNNLLTAIYSTPSSSSHTGSGFQKRSQDIIDRIKKLGGNWRKHE